MDDWKTAHRGYFQSLGLVPETITLMTISLSLGVGTGISTISTASIEVRTIASLGMVTGRELGCMDLHSQLSIVAMVSHPCMLSFLVHERHLEAL